MASLTNTKIKDTYDGLLKTTDNDALGGTYKLITDGLGNSSNVYLGTGGNVGIGESDPSGYWGQASNLVLNDSNTGLTIKSTTTGNGRVVFTDTKSSTSGLSDGGMIHYDHSGDSMRLHTNGSERMRIDSSGRVGIGTTSPRTKLHISGLTGDDDPSLGTSTAPLFVSNTANSYGLNIGVNNLGDAWLQAQSNTSATAYNILLNPLGGNVGIGTTSPASKFVVKGSGISPIVYFGNGVDNAPNRQLAFSGGSSGLVWDLDATGASSVGGQLTLSTSGSERMRIDSSGRVGIGTSSPTADLSVGSTSTSSGDVHLRTTKTTFSMTPSNTDAGGMFLDVGWASGGQGPFRFGIGGSEKMRITSGGDVLIGTQTANCGGAVSMHTHIKNDDFVLGITTGSGASKQAVRFANDTTAVGSINLSTTSTSYNTSSDYRLKENVVDLTGALDRVDQLEPKRFNFIADAETTVDGFIAHEVQSVIPEAVTGDKDAVDEEGNPQYQGIDQSKIVPLLVGAIKELKAEIETLKSQINS